MRARQKTCAFTGHRPEKLPWGDRENDPRCDLLRRRISDALEVAYRSGYRHFLCGMARGCDLYFAECILELRRTHPDVTLEAVLPYPAQADGWTAEQRARHQALVAASDWETVVSRRYSPACMLRRDRYLVDRASLLIAAYNGTAGGTRYTVEYAMRRGVQVMDLRIPERMEEN